jgi:hypothetical protein
MGRRRTHSLFVTYVDTLHRERWVYEKTGSKTTGQVEERPKTKTQKKKKGCGDGQTNGSICPPTSCH